MNWLPGYQYSVPVRVGNAACGQFQLDVWGEVLDGPHLSRQAGIEADENVWDLQRALLDYLEGHWDDPDNGLWEVRGDRRHFVHSKVMAWAGVDRAVQAVERFGLDGRVEGWRAVREKIHTEVCDRGYDPGRNTFTQFYGSTGLDAALLPIPRVGFLPWHDTRVAGTVDAAQRELCADGFLLRYQPQAEGGVDGLPGPLWHRPPTPGLPAVRAPAEPAQRPGPAQRGIRPGHRPTARQHSAGVQPRGARQRRPPPVPHRARSRRHPNPTWSVTSDDVKVVITLDESTS